MMAAAELRSLQQGMATAELTGVFSSGMLAAELTGVFSRG